MNALPFIGTIVLRKGGELMKTIENLKEAFVVYADKKKNIDEAKFEVIKEIRNFVSSMSPHGDGFCCEYEGSRAVFRIDEEEIFCQIATNTTREDIKSIIFHQIIEQLRQ